ncbi:MAG TPA: hypothetical protein PLO27_04375 [Marmoricola sp.]|nr:hypothetical protein [Marmoricola sp.]
MSNHTEINCQAQAEGTCGRLHVGDVVRVVYGGPAQVGFGLLGTVTAQPDASGFTVHFPDGAPALDNQGTVLDIITDDLTFDESELERI